MRVQLRAPRGPPAQLRVRLGKQRAQPGSWAGPCRHRVSYPASVSTMAGWPSSAVLLTPKEGEHESSRVGLSLPRPPWDDDGLSLGRLHVKARVKLLVMKRHLRSQGGIHHSASPRRKKKKHKQTGKQQEAWQAGCQVPPNQAPQSSCVGITNLLRTGAPVYKNSEGPATVLPPIL